MNCTSCGANLPPGANACPTCGVPTPATGSRYAGSASAYDPTIAASAYNASQPPPQTSYGPGSPGYDMQSPYESVGSNPYDATQSSMGPYGPYSPPPPPQTGQYTPLPPSAPPPQKPRNRLGLILALVALVVIIAFASIFFAVYQAGQNTNNANATATAQTNAKATAVARNQAATATAIASTYPFSNNLVLTDPLSDNSKGYNWDEITYNTGGVCKFSGQAYHVIQSNTNYFNDCVAKQTNFSDFTYQVEMTIIKGDRGGLIFRSDKGNTKFYYFRVNQDGLYSLLVYVDTTGTNARILAHGSTPGFTTGLDQTNLVGVVARGDAISLYVNKQLVTSVTDSTYSSGAIGVTADPNTNPTEVIYTNAKVWKL